MRTLVVVLVLALGERCSASLALRPAILRPAVRRHACSVMQELATPEVAAGNTGSLLDEEEAHGTTPEAVGQTTEQCAPVASTLQLLEWEKLSAQVAGFAGTARAREMLRRDGLPLPQARDGSERLLAETREAGAIEQQLAKPLELRGFHDLSMSVSLAQKGGVLGGEELAKLASSLTTAVALSKQLRDATDAAEESVQLGLLADLLNAVPLQAKLLAPPPTPKPLTPPVTF